MASKGSTDDPYEVSDSTDWLETPLTALCAVDSALRCQVCKDFYQTPMITSCSHTFCSLCIRRCFNNDGRCPACRAPDQELKLRCNWAVEELVEAFKKARPEVLDHARKAAINSGAASPRRKREETGLEETDEPSRKRTRSSGRKALQPTDMVTEIHDAQDDEDYISDELVPCPICKGLMTVEEVQLHLDHCNGDPRLIKRTGKTTKYPVHAAGAEAQKPEKRPERLPQMHYSMVKDNALRKKLADAGISATGSRQSMERRYTEWVTLWNANCDSKNPRGKNELRRELETWERTYGVRAASLNGAQISGAQIKEKDFDGSAWSSKHGDSFRDLIAKAQRKLKPPAPDSIANRSDTINDTISTNLVASASLAAAVVDAEMTNRDMGKHVTQVPEPSQWHVTSISGPSVRGRTPPIRYGETQSAFFQEGCESGQPLDSAATIVPLQHEQTTNFIDKDIGPASIQASGRPL